MLLHGKQHEQHELLFTVAARVHLGVGLDRKVHHEEVLQNALFVAFGMFLCPFIDPLFNLVTPGC